MEKNFNLKQIQEFFSKPLEENTFKVGDKITYLGHPGEITATKEYNGRNFVSVSYDKGKGKTKASDILTTDGTVKAVAEGFKDYLGYSSVEVSRPTQDQVDRFFALTQNETHYLNSKPVAGQEKTFNKMEVEPWDEYDLSNWNSLVRKAKAKGKSLDEAKVDYDFSERELIRVLRQLKRGASTEVDMIKAFTKALGRDLTKDELFSESIAKINEATEEDPIDTIIKENEIDDLAKELANAVEDKLEDKKDEVNEVIDPISILSYVLAGTTLTNIIAKYVGKLSKKYNFGKGEAAAKKIYDFTHKLESDFKKPIGRVVGLFTKDEKQKSLVTDGLFALLLLGLGAKAGTEAFSAIRKSNLITGGVSALKAALKGKDLAKLVQDTIQDTISAV